MSLSRFLAFVHMLQSITRKKNLHKLTQFAGLTEDCPLTKEKNYKYKLCSCCGNGLQLIIVCFVALTIGITTMLVLQILYTEDMSQVNTKKEEK